MDDIILVDIFDNEIGHIDKITSHATPKLHRAFSIFLIDGNKMLLQKRALNKYHSGGLWANSCCSHPRKGKTLLESAKDRLGVELGVYESIELEEIFNFTYLTKFNDNLFEYEFDHVLVGNFNGKCAINKDEISQVKWVDIDFLSKDLVANPTTYASWFLICAPKVISFMKGK